MNWKRVGRLLVCLVLVAALIVNVSPIRTEAVSLSVMGTAVSVVAWDVLAAAFIGCGIAAAADRTDFDAVVDAAEDYYKSVGVIDGNGAMDVYSIQNAGFDYGVPVDYVQALFDYAYETKVVSSSFGDFGLSHPIVSNGSFVEYGDTVFCFDNGSNVYATANHEDGLYVCRFHGPYTTSGAYQYFFVGLSQTQGASFALSNGQNRFMYDKVVIGEDTFYYNLFQTTNSSSVNLCGSALVPCEDGQLLSDFTYEECIVGAFTGTFQAGSLVTSDKNLSLGRVAPAESTLAEGYADWYSRSVTIQDENGDDIQVVPIGSASTGTEAGTYTQGDVWTGSAPTIIVIEDSNTGDAGTTTPDVDPNPDVTPDTDALTQAGFDASLATFLASLGAKLAEWFDKQFGILDAICSWVESIYGYVESIAEFIASILTLFEPVAEWFEALITGQTTIIDSIIALPGLIGDVMTGVLTEVLTAVFVPSADYLTVKVDALRARFPFIDGVISTGEYIRDSVSGDSGPPVIYVDLGRASSGNYGSQRVLLIDFSWYAEYKPTVDSVLSAALWAFFGWRVFLKLPGIISGESGYIGEVTAHREKMEKIRSGSPRKG